MRHANRPPLLGAAGSWIVELGAARDSGAAIATMQDAVGRPVVRGRFREQRARTAGAAAYRLRPPPIPIRPIPFELPSPSVGAWGARRCGGLPPALRPPFPPPLAPPAAAFAFAPVGGVYEPAGALTLAVLPLAVGAAYPGGSFGGGGVDSLYEGAGAILRSGRTGSLIVVILCPGMTNARSAA